MANKQKRKGTGWETDATELLNRYIGAIWKRIPLSGAIGTIMEVGSLKGDLTGKYDFIPSRLRAEAKVGYGGATQITVKREWFDKIREETNLNYNEIPCLVLKFSGSRAPATQHVIAFDFEAWEKILDWIKMLYEDNIELRELLGED